jgi:hypothetical protein
MAGPLSSCWDGSMIADLSHTLTHLSAGQSVGFAVCVATLVMLVYGWWNLGT